MKNNKVVKFYTEKYDLEKIKIKISNKEILFLIYDDLYYYYLHNNNRFIEASNVNSILNYVYFLNKKYKLEISNFYPVCFCDKTLVIALKTFNTNSTHLQKVKYDSINDKYKKLVLFHKANFETQFISSNIKKEIAMSQKYIRRYKFHEKVIKRYILTDARRKKKEFKELLDKILPNKNSIIDISCGDNSDIFQIAKKKKYNEIVGNDICINYLNTANNENVIYTNDDIEKNILKDKIYDVSFCKNTLHHLNNLSNINNVLHFLDRISSEIIIVEISNPKKEGGLPKLLNKYLYTKFLKDVGRCYIDFNEFKSIINTNFKNHSIEYQKFTNILGTYMIARITSKGSEKNEN